MSEGLKLTGRYLSQRVVYVIHWHYLFYSTGKSLYLQWLSFTKFLKCSLKTYSWNCCYLSLSLRLSGDVETNPGPTRSSRKLKTKKLTVIHLNTRSLLRHFNELQYFVSITCPEILCLSERLDWTFYQQF